MRVGAIILARANFGRWPDKVLYEIGGKPMIEWVIMKALTVGYDEVIVSTTNHSEDEPIVKVAEKHGVPVSYGPADDRHLRNRIAAEDYNLDYIACPAPCMPFFDVWLSTVTLKYCREHSGYEAYFAGTHSDAGYPAHLRSTELLYSLSSDHHAEQIMRHSGDIEKMCVVFHYLDPEIINRYLINVNIAYPLQGVIANIVCDHLGHFPKNWDEVIKAYMEVRA